MPWVRFDDRFPSHRKVRRLSDAAFRLHVSGIHYSAEHLTDGVIEERELSLVSDVSRPGRAVSELERHGLWEPEPGGWRIHDYLDYQPRASKVIAERERGRQRKEDWRRRRRNASRHAGTDPGTNAGTEGGTHAGTDAGTDSVRNAGASDGPYPYPKKERDFGGGRPVSERADTRNAPPKNDHPKRTDGRPADRCPRHVGRTDDPPCRSCRDAREAAEAWDRRHRLDDAMTIRRCPFCDADGWRYQRGLRIPLTPYVRCDHTPHQSAEEARRA